MKLEYDPSWEPLHISTSRNWPEDASFAPALSLKKGRTSAFFRGHFRLSTSDVSISRQAQTPALASSNPRPRNPALARPNPAPRHAGPGRLQRPLRRAGLARCAGRGRCGWPGWLIRRGGRSGCAGRQLVSGASSPHDVVADGGMDQGFSGGSELAGRAGVGAKATLAGARGALINCVSWVVKCAGRIAVWCGRHAGIWCVV